MADLHRYAAFISYSSKDAAFAARLHRTLEHYRIPQKLGAFQITDHPRAGNRLYPCFRDREELPSGHLGEAIEKALQDSSALIVVCSPHASTSTWVEKEIRFFEGLGRGQRIFAIIADGEPGASEHDNQDAECFPSALRHAARLRLGERPLEVVAGDARKGKDGWRNAWLKLVAGIIGSPLGALVDRDRKARRTRALVTSVTAAGLVVAVLAGTASIDEQAGRQALYEHGRALVEREVLTSQVVVRQPNPSDEEVVAVGDDPFVSARFLLSAMADTTNVLPGSEGAAAALRQTPAGVAPAARLGPVTRFAFSRDGARLLTRDGESVYTLRDGASGRAIRELGVLARDEVLRDDPWFHAFDFSEDGLRLLTRDPDGEWRLRDAATGEVVIAMGEGVHYAAFLPGGGRFVSVAGEADYTLRDSADGREVQSLGALRDFTPSRDGARLVSVGLDNRATLRDGRSGDALSNLGAVSEVGAPVHFSGENAAVMISAPDGGNILYDAQTGTPILQFGAHGPYFLIQRSPDAQRFLALTPSGSYELRDANTARPIVTLEDVLDLNFSLDGARLSRRDRANVTTLYDARAGGRIDRLALAHIVSVAPNMDRVVTFEEDHSYALRDPVAGTTFARLGSRVDRSAFSPDGSLLLLVGQRSTVELRDGRTGDLLFVAGAASEAAFSPGGERLILTGASDQTLLYSVGERHTEGGASLKRAVCSSSARAIGPFDSASRRGVDPAQRTIAERLRGRPHNPCDWRGLLSVSGWAQTLRYWAVRLGAKWDYADDECMRERVGFGCPARLREVVGAGAQLVRRDTSVAPSR